MSRFAVDYQVARATGVCAATGHMFQPGEACIATLCDRAEDDGFDRLDFSIESWEAGHRPERLFSYWRTTTPQPGQKRQMLVDDAVLLEVFDRLADDTRPQRAAFRFVIALILMRKKLLKFMGRESVGGGVTQQQEYWLLLPRGCEPDTPPIRLVNPVLSDDDVRELTSQLSEVLQGDF